MYKYTSYVEKVALTMLKIVKAAIEKHPIYFSPIIEQSLDFFTNLLEQNYGDVTENKFLLDIVVKIVEYFQTILTTSIYYSDSRIEKQKKFGTIILLIIVILYTIIWLKLKMSFW